MRMKFKFLLILLPLLYGCNSNEKTNNITVLNEVTIVEGMPFSLNIPQGETVLDSQKGSVYFVINNNSISGVSPNVDMDTAFDILLSDEKAIRLNVINQSVKEIDTPTRNYAFANSNIVKYNQFLPEGNNIPLVSIGSEQVNYPVTVSKYAHDLYAHYKSTGDTTSLDKFYINANWLRDNCVYTDYGFCSWRTAPAYTPYETGTDWPSAMAQGQAISVMISAYSLSQDTSYLKVAEDAISAFFYPAEKKGVMSNWEGGVWYEEYASENPAHVLNGFIFSMAGLYDAVDLLDSEAAKIAFNLGIENLKNKLTRYDADFTSLYDQNDQQLRFANAKARSLDGYHELHILQLAWLYQVTQEPLFLSMFQKFLADDIATFRTRKIKSGLSNRIESIDVSYSVRPETNGPSYLTDRIWTYGNYWSTNKNATEVIVNLNEINNSEGVKCLMMSSIDTKFFPKYFDVFSYVDGAWNLAVTREVVEQIHYTEHTWKYQGKEATARTYCFDEPIQTTDKFKLEVYLGSSNLIALKELDVHFRRPNIEQELLSIYDSWKVTQ